MNNERSTEPRGYLAIVLRTDIDRMPDIMRRLTGIPSTKVIYQRTSAGKLWIKDGNESEEEIQ